MTTLTQEPSTEQFSGGGWSSRFVVREMWATVSIVAMWLAVLFDGVYGGDMTFNSSPTNNTIIPSAVAVALFAASAHPQSPNGPLVATETTRRGVDLGADEEIRGTRPEG